MVVDVCFCGWLVVVSGLLLAWFGCSLLWWWVFDSLCAIVVVVGYFGGFCGFVVGWWLLLVCGLVYMRLVEGVLVLCWPSGSGFGLWVGFGSAVFCVTGLDGGVGFTF